ncbi:MAG: cysteine-rich CWC family protein [Cyclobacteriaceae bacterium]
MKHEQKYCPRCESVFECKVGAVNNCQCSSIKLSDAEYAFVREKFADCLCAECLKGMRTEFHAKKLNDQLILLFRKNYEAS